MVNTNMKFNWEYATISIGLALCAHYRFILLNRVRDLQKGERCICDHLNIMKADLIVTCRYCNMNYVTISAFALYSKYGPIVLSYDIACQWKIYIRNCILYVNFSAHLQVELLVGGDLCFVILKYHFLGHKSDDHSKYSFNLICGVGQMDGKEVECNWWWHDATTASICETDSGSHHDTLEDHFQWLNFKKLMNMGECLYYYMPEMCYWYHRQVLLLSRS